MPSMELLSFLLDFVLHVDKHLETFVRNYGLWVYALLFLIIFVETGVVVMPFLPGDSLLFVRNVTPPSSRAPTPIPRTCDHGTRDPPK